MMRPRTASGSGSGIPRSPTTTTATTTPPNNVLKRDGSATAPRTSTPPLSNITSSSRARPSSAISASAPTLTSSRVPQPQHQRPSAGRAVGSGSNRSNQKSYSNTRHHADIDYLSSEQESPLSLNGMLRELADGDETGRTKKQSTSKNIHAGGPNVSDILPSKRQKRELGQQQQRPQQQQQQRQNSSRNQQGNNKNNNKISANDNINADFDYGDDDDDDDDDEQGNDAEEEDLDDDALLMDDSFQMKVLGGAVLQDRETQVERLKQTLIAVQSQRDAYEAESQSLARENATLVNTVEECHRQVAQLHGQIKGLQNDKSHLLGERDSLAVRLRLLEARRDDDDVLLTERTQRAEQALADVEDDLKRSRQDAASAQLALDEAKATFESEKLQISRTLTRLQHDVERLSGETSARERLADAENTKLREHLAAANERIGFLEETTRQQEDQIERIEAMAREAEDRESAARGEAAAAGQAAAERDELAEELTLIARRHAEAHQRWKDEREQIVAVNIRLQHESQQDTLTIQEREREVHQLRRDVDDRDDKIHSLSQELSEAQKTAVEFQKNMSSLQYQHQKLAQRMIASNASRRSNMKLFGEPNAATSNQEGDHDDEGDRDDANNNNNNNNNKNSRGGNDDEGGGVVPLVAAIRSSTRSGGNVALSLQSVCDNAVRRVHVAHEETMKLTQENTSLRHQLTIANEERRAIEQLLQRKELEATELLRQRSDRVTELQERLAAEREACRATETERVSLLEKYDTVHQQLGSIQLDEDKLRHLAVECDELRRVRGNLEADNNKYVNQIARLEELNRTLVAQREDATRRLGNYKESTSKSIKECTQFAEKVVKDTELHFSQKLSTLEKQLGDRAVACDDRRRLKERVADLESQLTATQIKLKSTSQRLASEITKKEEAVRHASEKKVVDQQQADDEHLQQVEQAKAIAIEELKKMHQHEVSALRKRVGESLRREVQKLHHLHNVDHKSGRAWMREALAFFHEMDDISQVVARGAKAVDLDATSGGILEQIEQTIVQTLKLIAAERENSRQPIDPHIKEQLFGRIDSRLRDDELRARANDITRSFFGESSLRSLVDHQVDISPSRGGGGGGAGRGSAAGNSNEAVAVLREQVIATQLSRSVNKVVTQFMQTVRSGLTNAPRVVDVVDSHRHTFESMQKYGSMEARREEVRTAVEDSKHQPQQQQQQKGRGGAKTNAVAAAAAAASPPSVLARLEADDITNKVFDGLGSIVEDGDGDDNDGDNREVENDREGI